MKNEKIINPEIKSKQNCTETDPECERIKAKIIIDLFSIFGAVELRDQGYPSENVRDGQFFLLLKPLKQLTKNLPLGQILARISWICQIDGSTYGFETNMHSLVNAKISNRKELETENKDTILDKSFY